MHRFYAPPENFDDGVITLNQDEVRHLRDVLRMRGGESVHVFDGLGREYLCEISQVGRKEAGLRIIEEIDPASAESPLELTLGAAILKGEKFDWVMQKAVELGVTRLIPMITTRCDVKLKDSTKRADRWRKIALEASKQCGRARLMAVDEPLDFSEIVGRASNEDTHGVTLLFSEREGSPLSAALTTRRVTALIGPEGGWDDSELASARTSRIRIITLGGRILRAETAAVAISALLQNKFGDFN